MNGNGAASARARLEVSCEKSVRSISTSRNAHHVHNTSLPNPTDVAYQETSPVRSLKRLKMICRVPDLSFLVHWACKKPAELKPFCMQERKRDISKLSEVRRKLQSLP
jgi:hypothetical protein